MAIVKIDTRGATTFLKSEGTKLKAEFQKEMIQRVRKLSQQMQKDMSDAVNKGATGFTNRAVLFTYQRRSDTSVACSILIKDVQANYLYDIIVKPKAIDKFVNTSAARMTKQGNIAALHNNLQNKKYIVVKSKNGKERLIDTTKKDTKKKTKRVIGLRESKKRKMIYDFYAEAETGVKLLISDINGVFKITKG
ncbi:MAG: hypothetical protein E7I59_01265 [Phytobacter diazotrophicus]|nr:hypothetical protein [Phytobacter diazotrophicus]